MRAIVWMSVLLASGAPRAVQAQSPDEAPRYTLSGYVVDAASGEKLIGATVYAPRVQRGAATNEQGFFSLRLPADSVAVAVSYVGYQQQVDTLALAEDRRVVYELTPAEVRLDAVEVVADRTASVVEETQMSGIALPVATVRSLPVLLGETDILKTLQLMPGVQSGTEGTSGLHVRGGSPDQNLILLDGAPLYNVSHLFGFLSVFNTDVVNNVQMLKGGFPARYGGRLSSVVEITTDDGNLRSYETDGAVGLLASRLSVQGPLSEGNTSFVLSGRRTYADLLARPFQSGDDLTGYYFYDLNAKVNHRFDSGNQLVWSMYAGDDRFNRNIEESDAQSQSAFDFDFGWGNLTSTVRYNHIFGDRLFGSVSALYSRYRFDVDARDETNPSVGEPSVYRLQYESGIRDVGLKADFDYTPSTQHRIRFGANVIHHRFRPGATQYNETDGGSRSDTTLSPNPTTRSLEAALYAEDDVRLTSRLQANAGLRVAGFGVENSVYTSVQPRLSLRYRLTPTLALKASYARMDQNVHLLTNSSTGLPTDLWVPSTDRIAPQRSQQVAVGAAKTFSEGAFELTTEAYYKDMRNLIEYREGASFSLGADRDWEETVVVGDGWAYGGEVFLRRTQGRTTGWVGYTLAWAMRDFDALNDGEPFPYRYDRRHDVSAVLSHQATDVTRLSATWVYGTGDAVTLPAARHRSAPRSGSHPFPVPFGETEVYGERNGFRTPAYHRLDVGATFTWTGERTHRLHVGLYNVYNRQNPFFVYTEAQRGGGLEARQVSLFPILPMLNYSFSF